MNAKWIKTSLAASLALAPLLTYGGNAEAAASDKTVAFQWGSTTAIIGKETLALTSAPYIAED